MNLSGHPEENKQDLNESGTKIVPEGDRKKPPKKLLTALQSCGDDDREGATHSSCSNKNTSRPSLPIEEKRKDARRASNRASAARARKRHKLTVQVLESMLLKQKQESLLLRGQLDAALAENQQLRLMMAGEPQVVLDRERSLQRTFEQNTHSNQRAFGEPNRVLVRTRPTMTVGHSSSPRSFSLPLSSNDSHRYSNLALNQDSRHDEVSGRRETANAIGLLLFRQCLS